MNTINYLVSGMRKKLLIVVGTRPNFIKITRFKSLLSQHPHIDIKIVHTGQHYDRAMSDVFFDQFGIKPDFFLNAEKGSPVNQMASIMSNLEKLINETYQPDLIMVPGDVNSTLAAGLVANKMNIPLAHLESGLRSNDRKMPEELNRILVDEMAQYLFVTEPSGLKNIESENLKGKSYFVGNTMIDTICKFENEIEASDILKDLNVEGNYILLTIHRPSNVDRIEDLTRVHDLINTLSSKNKLVFPIHPRTKDKLEKYNLLSRLTNNENIILVDPLGYFEFQHLIKHCQLIITDSGGIQEESTFRQIPCLTLRKNTERPITITEGSNELVEFNIPQIAEKVNEITGGNFKQGKIPQLWDGKATDRIMKIIAEEILKDET